MGQLSLTKETTLLALRDIASADPGTYYFEERFSQKPTYVKITKTKYGMDMDNIELADNCVTLIFEHKTKVMELVDYFHKKDDAKNCPGYRQNDNIMQIIDAINWSYKSKYCFVVDTSVKRFRTTEISLKLLLFLTRGYGFYTKYGFLQGDRKDRSFTKDLNFTNDFIKNTRAELSLPNEELRNTVVSHLSSINETKEWLPTLQTLTTELKNTAMQISQAIFDFLLENYELRTTRAPNNSFGNLGDVKESKTIHWFISALNIISAAIFPDPRVLIGPLRKYYYNDDDQPIQCRIDSGESTQVPQVIFEEVYKTKRQRT